jgi:hypothetical protein
VTQRALLTLAYKLEPVDFAAARATLDRSLSLKGNAWVTCHVEYERYRMRAEGELDAQGSGEARFLTIARDCAKAGNQRLAAFGFEAAARNAWNPNATTTLTAEALQHAQVIGGERLDGSLFEQAGNLRKRGQVTQADDVLVAVMGTHLKAIALAASGLPGAEKRLDDELLRRVGVERGTSPTEPAGEAGLVAQAHRRAFARALLRWADRTDLSSKVQGDYYRAIADDIDPPRVPRSSIGDDRMNKRLAVAKLPLADIARSTDPPLRGTGADVAEAFGAIYDRFFEIHADNGPTERLGELEEAARKLARWLERPRVSLRAAILQAALAQANGDWGRFAERLKAAQEITKDSPWEESRVLAWEEKWAERVDRKRVPEIRARRATLAKRTSAEDWVRQTHRAAYAAWDIGGKPFAPEVDRVLDVAKELKKVEAWEEAALAMELADFGAGLGPRFIVIHCCAIHFRRTSRPHRQVERSSPNARGEGRAPRRDVSCAPRLGGDDGQHQPHRHSVDDRGPIRAQDARGDRPRARGNADRFETAVAGVPSVDLSEAAPRLG